MPLITGATRDGPKGVSHLDGFPKLHKMPMKESLPASDAPASNLGSAPPSQTNVTDLPRLKRISPPRGLSNTFKQVFTFVCSTHSTIFLPFKSQSVPFTTSTGAASPIEPSGPLSPVGGFPSGTGQSSALDTPAAGLDDFPNTLHANVRFYYSTYPHYRLNRNLAECRGIYSSPFPPLQSLRSNVNHMHQFFHL